MKTMVMGASPRSSRFSHIVTLKLQEAGFEVIPIGINPGIIGGQPIENLYEQPAFRDVHTISMYLNRINQRFWYQYMMDLNPRRVVFNPGSENPEFSLLLKASGIDYEEACTLVMLAGNSYLVT